MDIVSHGLWGAITFGRKSRWSFWLAFMIGLAPDLLSFGILWSAATLGLEDQPDFSHGPPPESSIPQYVHDLYNVTHSLVVFLIVFVLVWLLLKQPLWELAAWGLHVLVDVPTHSHAFFPTPVLWPLFNWKFNGTSRWGFVERVKFLRDSAFATGATRLEEPITPEATWLAD